MSVKVKEIKVNETKLHKLKHLLGANDDSETIQRAIDQALEAEEIIKSFKRLRKRGTWVDAYNRTGGRKTE
jgi:hypothetical protein